MIIIYRLVNSDIKWLYTTANIDQTNIIYDKVEFKPNDSSERVLRGIK